MLTKVHLLTVEKAFCIARIVSEAKELSAELAPSPWGLGWLRGGNLVVSTERP